MSQAMILSIVRHVLTAVGGIAVAKGYIDSDTLTQVVGAVVTLVGAGWGAWNAKK